MARRAEAVVLELDGHEVKVSSPEKVYFPDAGVTKLDLARYYVAVSEGALRHVRDRPLVLRRFVEGIGGEAFYQKRAPARRPDWLRTVTLRFPSGRTADEVVVRESAALVYLVNLGCIELHPHPVRADDLEHPDELRIDLDPTPGVPFEEVRSVAMAVRELLDEHGIRSFPKTSGSRGMHVYVRIERRYGFDEVRRGALAVAREIERRMPERATSAWWKEQRHGVFLDFNQNAKDRTIAAAYSVRPRPDARVSAPLTWEEVPRCDPAAHTLFTMPERFARLGDVHEAIDQEAFRIDSLLALADEQDASGVADAPWPPHHAKRAREPRRAPPSRARPQPRPR
jgi:bifunctional non-homologous end joining protein LigD